MTNEKMQINLDKDCQKAEVIIREVGNVNELPVLEPENLNVRGTLGLFSHSSRNAGVAMVR